MKSLRGKLLLSYFIVLVVGVTVMLVAAQFAAPAAYMQHLANSSAAQSGTPVPGAGTGQHGPGQGQGQGLGLGAAQGQGLANFRAGMFEALSYAVVAALLAAIAVSIFFSRRIISPLQAMTTASQRIAEGHYDERVKVSGADEIARLGERFNQMAEKLEQTEAMRRQLIGDVSHELRTPLTGIKGYMEGLVDGVLPASPETFEQVHREADRLSRLVDDLQELSRVEAGAYTLEIHPVSFSALAQTTAKRLAPAYDSKQVTLTLHLPADLPPVLADEDRLMQILTNLLGNALMYTPPAGQVTLSAAHTGREVRVSVKDTGIGIPAKNLAHIFDRFYRVDKSRSRQAGGGSGIGLTIARAMVEAHGGRIWAESAGQGLGSTFSFTLKSAPA